MARDVDRDEPWHDILVAGRGEAKTDVRKVADSYYLLLNVCTSYSNLFPPDFTFKLPFFIRFFKCLYFEMHV